MASEFDDGLPLSQPDPSGAKVSTAHPDSPPAAFDAGLPVSAPPQKLPPLLGTSWQKVSGTPVPYAPPDTGAEFTPGVDAPSPEMVSGILHGVREGIIDRPALGLANFWDWATGGNQSDKVRQQNKDAADAARAAASNDPLSFNVGNIVGKAGSQMAVAGPALRAVGAATDLIPAAFRLADITIPRVAPWITGAAGEKIPGVIGTAARTAAGTTSGAASGGLTALLSGDDPVRGVAEGGMVGGSLSLGLQGIARALQTLRGTYVPPEVRTPGGTWQASDETAKRAVDAQTLLDHDVPVMTRQVSGDPAMRVTDAPWSGASGDIANQQQAYRRAALGKVTGEPRPGSNEAAPSLATDGFVKDQGTRIGNNFQGVANRNNIDFGTSLAPDLTRLSVELQGVDPATRQALAPYLKTLTQSVSRDPATGQPIITGQKYLDLTSSGSPLQTLAGSDGLPAQYAQRIINMLHDGLAASASPADQALLTASRQQYRALQAVKAARGSDGSFEPKDLFAATDAQSRRYGGSSGTLDPLAKAGTTVLQPSYGSGKALGGVAATAAPTAAAALPGALGATLGATGLLGTLGTVALPAGVAGLAVPHLLEAASRNPENLARAIRLLQGGAEYGPYGAVRPAIAPAVAATQQ